MKGGGASGVLLRAVDLGLVPRTIKNSVISNSISLGHSGVVKWLRIFSGSSVFQNKHFYDLIHFLKTSLINF